MSVFKNIKNATYQIELLKKRLPTVKNKQQQINLVNLINTFISLLNDCESLLDKNLQSDVVDRLLLASLYSKMEAAPLDAVIDIHKIVTNIDAEIEDTRALQKWRIINLLRQKEINSVVEDLPYNIKDNGLCSLSANEKQINSVCDRINKVTSFEEYDTKIEALLKEFKQYIQWN